MGATSTFSDVAEGTPFTYTTLPVCVDGEGTIEVTTVAPIDDQNITIKRFAVVESADGILGADYAPMEELGIDPEVTVVTRPCDEDKGPALVAVELVRTGATTGWSDGFEVHYEAGDSEATTTVHVKVVLCAPGDEMTQDCSIAPTP